jgi:predicted RNase H-like HicB family nuclease
MRSYIALVHKETGSDYGVSFPDLPGLVSVASTLDEARALAVEGLALHLRGMAEDGEAIPEPSSLEDIMADRENRDGVAILVEVADTAPKVMRINITMPEDALNEIDRHAERLGLTRSGFLLSAAREALKRQGKAA